MTPYLVNRYLRLIFYLIITTLLLENYLNAKKAVAKKTTVISPKSYASSNDKAELLILELDTQGQLTLKFESSNQSKRIIYQSLPSSSDNKHTATSASERLPFSEVDKDTDQQNTAAIYRKFDFEPSTRLFVLYGAIAANPKFLIMSRDAHTSKPVRIDRFLENAMIAEMRSAKQLKFLGANKLLIIEDQHVKVMSYELRSDESSSIDGQILANISFHDLFTINNADIDAVDVNNYIVFVATSDGLVSIYDFDTNNPRLIALFQDNYESQSDKNNQDDDDDDDNDDGSQYYARYESLVRISDLKFNSAWGKLYVFYRNSAKVKIYDMRSGTLNAFECEDLQDFSALDRAQSDNYAITPNFEILVHGLSSFRKITLYDTKRTCKSQNLASSYSSLPSPSSPSSSSSSSFASLHIPSTSGISHSHFITIHGEASYQTAKFNMKQLVINRRSSISLAMHAFLTNSHIFSASLVFAYFINFLIVIMCMVTNNRRQKLKLDFYDGTDDGNYNNNNSNSNIRSVRSRRGNNDYDATNGATFRNGRRIRSRNLKINDIDVLHINNNNGDDDQQQQQYNASVHGQTTVGLWQDQGNNNNNSHNDVSYYR